LLDCCGVVE